MTYEKPVERKWLKAWRMGKYKKKNRAKERKKKINVFEENSDIESRMKVFTFWYAVKGVTLPACVRPRHYQFLPTNPEIQCLASLRKWSSYLTDPQVYTASGSLKITRTEQREISKVTGRRGRIFRGYFQEEDAELSLSNGIIHSRDKVWRNNLIVH